jgi:hypothetical protein
MLHIVILNSLWITAFYFREKIPPPQQDQTLNPKITTMFAEVQNNSDRKRKKERKNQTHKQKMEERKEKEHMVGRNNKYMNESVYRTVQTSLCLSLF